MGFFKKKQSEQPVAVVAEQSGSPESKEAKPIRPRPQVMLIDLDNEAGDVLKAAGYNVTVGSFGTPYKVARGSGLTVVKHSHQLTGYTEQDIVIVDTARPDAVSNTEPGESVRGILQLWASHESGEIDPRPLAMSLVKEKLDRILESGGVFIVFVHPKEGMTLTLGRLGVRGLDVARTRFEDTWSFLSVLGAVNTSVDHGQDMQIVPGRQDLGALLQRHLKGRHFTCALTPDAFGPDIPYIQKRWKPLVLNRFGATVGAMIGPNENHKGLVFLFPAVNDRSAFLRELLDNILPEMVPNLFPDNNTGRWVHRQEYESQRVIEMQNQIERTIAEAQREIEDWNRKIDAAQEEYGFMYDLLRETGDKLVAAVKKALEVIGFSRVVDVDAENVRLGRTTRRDEDLWIEESGLPLLLVEVKGLTKLAPDAESLQAWKYLAPRMKELKRVDIRALAIINHQRYLAPLERDNERVFRQEIITNAEEHEFGLMTTWDLFRIVRNMRANEWNPEVVKPVFYRSGKIGCLPAHYEPLGFVERYLDKLRVASIRLKEVEELRVGERIAFLQSIDLYEQHVESMQVNKEQRMIAIRHELAGIKTPFTESQAKVGTRVFRVRAS